MEAFFFAACYKLHAACYKLHAARFTLGTIYSSQHA